MRIWYMTLACPHKCYANSPVSIYRCLSSMESPISISILEVLGWGRLSSAKIPSFKSDRGQTHDSTVETSLLCFDKREALQTYKLHPWQEKKKEFISQEVS